MMNFHAARSSDAQELMKLNVLFNGIEDCGGMSAADIESSLKNNPQELVCVAEEDGGLIGFLLRSNFQVHVLYGELCGNYGIVCS